MLLILAYCYANRGQGFQEKKEKNASHLYGNILSGANWVFAKSDSYQLWFFENEMPHYVPTLGSKHSLLLHEEVVFFLIYTNIILYK